MLAEQAPAGAQETGGDGRHRGWPIAMGAIFLVGLAIRIASVLVRPHLPAGGDPLEYVGQANLLVDGKGWIDPIWYMHNHSMIQTAKLPPLFTMLMALCSLTGLKSFFAHRIWSAILGSTAVPVAGMLAREICGRRFDGRKIGVLAAAVVAVYPNMWLSDGLVMSETISPIMVMLVVWAGYRMLRDPTPRRTAVLGLAIGFAALARDEMVLFALLVLLPIVILARDRDARQKLKLVGLGAACIVVVIAPWVGFNLSRFSHPVFISDRFGLTLASANCEASWYGDLRGYWSMPCSLRAASGVHGDESELDAAAQKVGARFIRHHLGGLPAIEAVRLGRTFGLYRPVQQINLDAFAERRPRPWALVGLWMYYGLAAGAVAGAVVLKRRGVPLFPVVAVALDVVFAVVVTYGQTRFRATLEPFLVILTAVAAGALIWREPASTPQRSSPT